MNSDRIKNWPKAERPREKLLAEGADKQTDANLLAVILRVGRGTFKKGEVGQSAQALANALLQDFNGLKGLDRSTVQDLLEAPGLSDAKDANIHAREYQLYLPSKAELRRKLVEWAGDAGDE